MHNYYFKFKKSNLYINIISIYIAVLVVNITKSLLRKKLSKVQNKCNIRKHVINVSVYACTQCNQLSIRLYSRISLENTSMLIPRDFQENHYFMHASMESFIYFIWKRQLSDQTSKNYEKKKPLQIKRDTNRFGDNYTKNTCFRSICVISSIKSLIMCYVTRYRYETAFSERLLAFKRE